MAIEAKEFTEKDELIAKFYTLRAGLSAVAEETEQIRQNEMQQRELKRTAEKHRKEVESMIYHEKYELDKKLQPAIDDISSNLWKEKSDYEKNRLVLSKLTSSNALNGIMHDTHLNGWWVLIIVCGLAWFGILFAELLPESLGASAMLWGWIIALFISLLIGNLIRLLMARKKLKSEINKYRESVDRGKARIDQWQEELTQKRQEKAEQEKKIESRKTDPENAEYFIDLYQNDINEMDSQLNQEIIPLHTARAQVITQALHQQFDSILMEADWENVDLLIFYLSTGRADSLKEALQLVDRQRQTDQLSYAIRDASQHIANTMRDNTYRLAGVMTGCFKELSSQIQASHTAILASTNRTAEAVERLTGSVSSLGSQIHSLSSSIENQNQTLIESKDLNAALLNQANKSSQDLMYELRYNQRYWQ